MVREALAPVLARLRAAEIERDHLVARLRTVERERDQWHRRADALKAQTDTLKGELEEARRAAKRQAAPFARRCRKKHPQRPGRKPGHAAARRPAPPHIDAEVFVPLQDCPDCGGAVEDVHDLAPQVVIELPPDIKLQAVCYHGQSGYCPCCGKRVRSRHPDQCNTATGAAGVQLGPRLLALAVDLHHRVGVTTRKVVGVFDLFFGLHLCAATISRAAQRIAGRCAPTHQALITEARRAAVVHADETGWYITEAARKAWLWVFAVPEPRITLYAIRLSRGGDVPLEILGADFAGVLGVDGWAGYVNLACRKGQCAAHLLRRCAELLEVQKQGAARFAHAVQRVLLAAMAVKHLHGELPPDDFAACCDQVRGELEVLLAGRIVEPANLRFLKHLRNHADELLTFLDVPLLEPTNNLGEREIRPAVVMRKVSTGNRTEPGAHAHEVIASLSRTAERNRRRFVDLLPPLLRSPETDRIMAVLPMWDSPPAPPGGSRCPHPSRPPARCPPPWASPSTSPPSAWWPPWKDTWSDCGSNATASSPWCSTPWSITSRKDAAIPKSCVISAMPS